MALLLPRTVPVVVRPLERIPVERRLLCKLIEHRPDLPNPVGKRRGCFLRSPLFGLSVTNGQADHPADEVGRQRVGRKLGRSDEASGVFQTNGGATRNLEQSPPRSWSRWWR
jgi:hypothetical protein